MNKFFKRALAVVLAITVVAAVFAGCSKGGKEQTETTDGKQADIGLFYSSAEANSKYQVDKIGEELKKLGYTTKEYSFADSNDLAAVLNTAVSETKAIYVPTDNTCANNAELINNICEPAGIPVIAGEEGICKGCGVATLSISYYDLGVETAKMAYEVLVNGADVSTMDISYVDASTLVKEVDKTRAEKLGITVPEGFVNIGEGGASENKVPEGLPKYTGDKVFSIGICQLIQHVALDAATQGFMDALTQMLGKDHVKFDQQNASGESATCATIVNQFVSKNVDLILANATPALQAAATATNSIPILGTSVTEYGVALDIKDFNGKTGINVSGTSDLAPLDQQAALFQELGIAKD